MTQQEHDELAQQLYNLQQVAADPEGWKKLGFESPEAYGQKLQEVIDRLR